MFVLIAVKLRDCFDVEEFVEESTSPPPLISIADDADVPQMHTHA